MKYSIYISICTIFFSIFGTFGQENLIYEKVQIEKANGTEFIINNLIFLPSKKNESVLQNFLQPEKVSFLTYNLNIENLNEKNIAIQVLIENKWLTLELIEVQESFYNYEVIMSSGKRRKGSREHQRHFRGIVKDDPNSLVALSLFKDNIAGIISNNQGNYNIGLIKNTNQVIIYNDKNRKDQPSFSCETKDDDFLGYDTKVLSQLTKKKTTTDNCVQFHYETEYDLFQQMGYGVEGYVIALHNQVALLYQNENITTTISYVRIWDTPDPITNWDLYGVLFQFQEIFRPPNPLPLNGDLGFLLTSRNIGGGIAASFNGICGSPIANKLAVAGNIESSFPSIPNYSWSVHAVTHEFGHLMGSRHTHACVWNGNNTQIDDCGNPSPEGSSCYDYGNPIIPIQGGTIMSYCHIKPVGVNFNLGFGPQPGNVIRDKVANGSCLDSCTVCFYDLTITLDVNANEYDYKETENTITAVNNINDQGTAEYDAAVTVYLKPGFNAKSGSAFRAYIEGCSSTITDGEVIDGLQNSDNYDAKLNKDLNLNPNPTSDLLYISSLENMYSWEISNPFGIIQRSGTFKMADAKNAEIDLSNLITGVYYVKVVFKDGEITTKTLIKE